MEEKSAMDKSKIHQFKILGGILGVLILAGVVFGAYKFGQRQIQPGPQPTPGGQKVFCKDPRPEICTMEMIIPPPYICGSDGKSYGNKCSTCANFGVEWYVIQDNPCEREFCGGIAGIECPLGYRCQLDGNYPDAGGNCVKE